MTFLTPKRSSYNGSMIIPQKLRAGDEIRVVAPATSLAVISEDQRIISAERFANLGLKLSFGKHASELDQFSSSSIESRVSDLHDAFADSSVKAILSVLGGFNSNQLLKFLDFDLIKKNPKIFCGYSDITALALAIFAKTGLLTYSGPHYSSFSMLNGFEYTLSYFQKCLMSEAPFEITAAAHWSDDAWYLDQSKRVYLENSGPLVINPGEASGQLLGGNLCTMNLLQGTEFMPSIGGSILFIEDDYESKAHHFDRDLQSLLHLPEASTIRGLVIGRFQKESNISTDDIQTIVKSKRELGHIPVIANADFGHISPIFTFPIGGFVKLFAKEDKVSIQITTH